MNSRKMARGMATHPLRITKLHAWRLWLVHQASYTLGVTQELVLTGLTAKEASWESNNVHPRVTTLLA